MTKTSIIKAVLTSLIFAVPAAQAVVIDFNGFANGTIMDDEYAISHGLTISAVNKSTGPNLAVIFDTTPSDPNSSNFSADPDLIGPFDSINPALADGFDPENVLIIQENSSGCDLLSCSRPDDEGSRPAGIISFQFAKAIELLSLDFFDIETAEDGATPDNRIRLFDSEIGGNEIAANTYYTPNTNGDNLWNQILFNGVTGVRRIEVYFGGSGALDNLKYNVVPVPAAFWLFATALIGFIGFSRRTSI
jgi:hypothetical protein